MTPRPVKFRKSKKKKNKFFHFYAASILFQARHIKIPWKLCSPVYKDIYNVYIEKKQMGKNGLHKMRI